ncbi:MAG: hypothetical protein LBD08_06225 [Treponema sp.]|nr:hypothetical protein [Treponema sp.]
MKKRVSGGALVCAAWLLAGCATTVQMKVSHVPAMDTAGIRRIAIQPFTVSDYSDTQKKTAALITSEVTRRIMNTGHFTVVDYREVERLQKAGESVENHVDAIFIGQIISLNIQDSQRQVQETDYETKKEVIKTYYKRRAELNFNYNFMRSRDGSLVGVVSKNDSLENEQPSRAELPSADELVHYLVTNYMLQGMERDVAPWTETKNVALMKPGKRESKDTVKRMKDAAAFAKDGSYNRALDIYTAVFADTGSFEAGYNMTLLYEAKGDINEARSIAQRLYDETGSPKAGERLAQISKTIADQAALSGTYSDTRSQFDKVMETVIPLIKDNLPGQPAVAVQNVAKSAGRSLADRAVDTIAYTLREDGMSLVDRGSQRMLEAERNLQSTNWEDFDDSTIAGFGRQAGVQVFILVAVSGTSSARMLQVRLLDVASGRIIYQTPPSDEMML